VISCDRRESRDGGNHGTRIAGRRTLSTDDDRRGAERELAYDERASDRLTLFSDAVAAIAITLLAIDLPVPEGATTTAFWTSVHHNSSDYVAFLISFVIIANVWSAHHDIFRYVKRVDAHLREFNMIWLLTIVLIPFATRLLNPAGPESGDTRALRYGFYAVVQVVESGALLVMLRYMVSHGLAPDFPPSTVASMSWRSLGVVIAFALSIPVFIVTSWGWLIWIAVPMLLGRIRQRRPPASHSH
jgi:uncharacterized membrane protein